MRDTAKPVLPECLREMSDKEIGLWVHSLYPDELDPGINRARCDVVLQELGRELPEDWWHLMTDGALSDCDFPAWGNPDLSALIGAGVKVYSFGV